MAQGRTRRSAGNGARAGIADPGRIIDAAMALAAAQGWRNVSLAAVANAAGLPILQVYRVFPSKTAIVCGLFRHVDEAILSTPPEPEADERPRDRVFDLLMRRFDALQPYRLALRALRRDLLTDPVTAVAAGTALLRSMRLVLEAADVARHGIGAIIATKLTAAAYLAAAHTWYRDESPDLAPTMAALDRRLRSIEPWLVSGSRSVGNAAVQT
jgi:AcrR family transcriptional regulator